LIIISPDLELDSQLRKASRKSSPIILLPNALIAISLLVIIIEENRKEFIKLVLRKKRKGWRK
jgi:hypothetical protein